MVRRGVCRASGSPDASAREGTAFTPPSVPSAPSPWLRAESRAGGLARARTGQVDQAELADLHLVAPGQRRDVDRLAVDVGAVEAADVVHGEAAALTVELHVPAADGDVVEEDVAVGVPAGGGDVLVEQEATAGVRAALDDQQGRARGQ